MIPQYKNVEKRLCLNTKDVDNKSSPYYDTILLSYYRYSASSIPTILNQIIPQINVFFNLAKW